MDIRKGLRNILLRNCMVKRPTQRPVVFIRKLVRYHGSSICYFSESNILAGSNFIFYVRFSYELWKPHAYRTCVIRIENYFCHAFRMFVLKFRDTKHSTLLQHHRVKSCAHGLRKIWTWRALIITIDLWGRENIYLFIFFWNAAFSIRLRNAF